MNKEDFMIDCQIIKQGAMFYVPDMSGDVNAIFTGEHYPKKCRPWIVVSNDVANGHNTRINVVPVYSRNRLSIPTDVYFSYDNRDCVACCNQVMSIEADKIETRGYVGTISTEILDRIKKALCIQFAIDVESSTTNTNTVETAVKNEPVTIDTDEIVNTVLSKLNIESVVTNELIKLLITTNINATANISLSNILPVPPIKDIVNNVVDSATEPVVENDVEKTDITIDTPTTIKNNSNNNIPKHSKKSDKKKNLHLYTKSGKRRINGESMSIEQCKEFCIDAKTMTFEELATKWANYGLKDATKDIIHKKKYAIKQRLIKEGIPLP
jgi:mRNA-degrading endonuclease toxin of MazEF toxin-antitoxin module